jgi:hypothetical protein
LCIITIDAVHIFTRIEDDIPNRTNNMIDKRDRAFLGFGFLGHAGLPTVRARCSLTSPKHRMGYAW